MKVQEFKKGLSKLNYVLFDDDTLLLFNDLELYDRNTETSVKFNSFDELLTYNHNGLTMVERICYTIIQLVDMLISQKPI